MTGPDTSTTAPRSPERRSADILAARGALAALPPESPAEDRVRLVGELWRAGERNIAEIAHAAGSDRETVLADLAANGIDPFDPREKQRAQMEWVAWLYTGKDRTLKEIVEETGYRVHQIQKALDLWEVQRSKRGRRLKNMPPPQKLAQMYGKDVTVAQLADRLGVGRERVQQALRAAGVPVRREARPMPSGQALVRLWRDEGLNNLAKRLGVGVDRLRAALANAGVTPEEIARGNNYGGQHILDPVKDELLDLYDRGYTMQELADRYEVQRQQVRYFLYREGRRGRKPSGAEREEIRQKAAQGVPPRKLMADHDITYGTLRNTVPGLPERLPAED